MVAGWGRDEALASKLCCRSLSLKPCIAYWLTFDFFDKCCHFSKGFLFGIWDSAPLLKPVSIYFLFVVYKFFININKHSEVQFILGKRDTEHRTPPSPPPLHGYTQLTVKI